MICLEGTLMSNCADAARVSSDERLCEVAIILAAGCFWLRQRPDPSTEESGKTCRNFCPMALRFHRKRGSVCELVNAMLWVLWTGVVGRQWGLPCSESTSICFAKVSGHSLENQPGARHMPCRLRRAPLYRERNIVERLRGWLKESWRASHASRKPQELRRRVQDRLHP